MEYGYAEEITIDLGDMLFYFLKKWRSLLSLLLVGALLGGGWALIPETRLEQKDIKETVLVNMTKAAESRDLYRQQKRYMEESLLMQMDANNVYEGELSYHVSADKELNLVRAEYEALQDVSLAVAVREASGYDVALKYVEELIKSTAEITTDSKGDNSTATLHISYRVTADSEEACSAMLDVVRDGAEQLQKDLSRQYADYSVVKITDMVSQAAAKKYIQSQDTNNQQLNTYFDNAVALEKGFSEEELDYYRQNFLGKEPMEKSLLSYAKKIVICAFLAGVVWLVWYLMKYFMDQSLKTVREVQEVSKLFLLGRVKSEKNLKGIDKWLDGLQEKTRPALDEPAYVAAVIDSRKAGEAVFCGNRRAEEVCRIMEEITSGCGGLVPCDLTSASAEALKKAKQLGQAVLVVRTGKTKKAELLREIELCKMQSVELLGVVVAD